MGVTTVYVAMLSDQPAAVDDFDGWIETSNILIKMVVMSRRGDGAKRVIF